MVTTIIIITIVMELLYHHSISLNNELITKRNNQNEGNLLQLFNMQMSPTESGIIANLLPMDGPRFHPQFNRLLPNAPPCRCVLTLRADALLPPPVPLPFAHHQRPLPLQQFISF